MKVTAGHVTIGVKGHRKVTPSFSTKARAAARSSLASMPRTSTVLDALVRRYAATLGISLLQGPHQLAKKINTLARPDVHGADTVPPFRPPNVNSLCEYRPVPTAVPRCLVSPAAREHRHDGDQRNGDQGSQAQRHEHHRRRPSPGTLSGVGQVRQPPSR